MGPCTANARRPTVVSRCRYLLGNLKLGAYILVMIQGRISTERNLNDLTPLSVIIESTIFA